MLADPPGSSRMEAYCTGMLQPPKGTILAPLVRGPHAGQFVSNRLRSWSSVLLAASSSPGAGRPPVWAAEECRDSGRCGQGSLLRNAPRGTAAPRRPPDAMERGTFRLEAAGGGPNPSQRSAHVSTSPRSAPPGRPPSRIRRCPDPFSASQRWLTAPSSSDWGPERWPSLGTRPSSGAPSAGPDSLLLWTRCSGAGSVRGVVPPLPDQFRAPDIAAGARGRRVFALRRVSTPSLFRRTPLVSGFDPLSASAGA